MAAVEKLLTQFGRDPANVRLSELHQVRQVLAAIAKLQGKAN